MPLGRRAYSRELCGALTVRRWRVMRLKILFGHANGGQFVPLHRYLNESGLADSWLLCSVSYWEDNRGRISNLIPSCDPEPPCSSGELWSRIDKTSRARNTSHQFSKKIVELLPTADFDLYVGHV